MAWFIKIVQAIVAFGPSLVTGTRVDLEAPADPLARRRGRKAAVSKRTVGGVQAPLAWAALGAPFADAAWPGSLSVEPVPGWRGEVRPADGASSAEAFRMTE